MWKKKIYILIFIYLFYAVPYRWYHEGFCLYPVLSKDLDGSCICACSATYCQKTATSIAQIVERQKKLKVSAEISLMLFNMTGCSKVYSWEVFFNYYYYLLLFLSNIKRSFPSIQVQHVGLEMQGRWIFLMLSKISITRMTFRWSLEVWAELQELRLLLGHRWCHLLPVIPPVSGTAEYHPARFLLSGFYCCFWGIIYQMNFTHSQQAWLIIG